MKSGGGSQDAPLRSLDDGGGWSKSGVLMLIIRQSTKPAFYHGGRDVAQTKEKAINETKQTMIQVRRFKILL